MDTEIRRLTESLKQMQCVMHRLIPDFNRLLEITMETDDTEPDASPRINGFASGDRVSIVSGPYTGAYGKVHESWGGCLPESCVTQCHLVWVDLMSIPAEAQSDTGGRYPHGDARYRYQGWGVPNRFRFRVNEVTHLD